MMSCGMLWILSSFLCERGKSRNGMLEYKSVTFHAHLFCSVVMKAIVLTTILHLVLEICCFGGSCVKGKAGNGLPVPILSKA